MGAELGGGQGEPVPAGVWGLSEWGGQEQRVVWPRSLGVHGQRRVAGERRESESAPVTVTAQHGWKDARGAVALTLGSARRPGGGGVQAVNGLGLCPGQNSTEPLAILRLPLKGGAERLGAYQYSSALCHLVEGYLGGCPTRPETAP